jgi:hypothetical protein
MSTPASFPANVVLADGRAAVVYDQNGYRAALAMGAAHNAATPSQTAHSGAATLTVQQTALSLDETDGRPSHR